jgi:hypothetical protein
VTRSGLGLKEKKGSWAKAQKEKGQKPKKKKNPLYIKH